MTLGEKSQEMVPSRWQAANEAYLRGHLARLRLLLRRRVLWLRRQWRGDALQQYQRLVISEAQADLLLAGENREAEARFYAEDPEAVALGRAIAAAEEELAEQERASAEAGAPLALDWLAHLFHLTRFDREVLLLCLAPELDPAFERLYAYVQDDLTRKLATPHLAISLFVSEEEESVHDAFLPGAPLRRFRLIAPERETPPAPGFITCALRVEARVADFLRGANRPEERVMDLLRPPPAAIAAPPHRQIAQRLAGWLQRDAGPESWPVLNLIGPPGAGKLAVAREVCDHLGFQLWVLEAGRLASFGPDRPEVLGLLEREARLLRLAFYLEVTEADSPAAATDAACEDLIRKTTSFLLIGSRERWRGGRETVCVRVPKPDAEAQRLMWEEALAGTPHTLEGHLDAVVQQFDFGPQAIAQAVFAAAGQAQLRAEDGVVTADDLWQACREHAGWQLEELAQRLLPSYAWEDLVLPSDTLRQLREMADQVASRAQVYQAWGFGAQRSRGRGISALFSGASGTGKTMAAEILARHLDLDLYRIDLAGVVSKYIGETEKNLRKVFDVAEQSGAVLFFDEADALFGKRTEVKDSHDRYANIEVSYLLQRMEDYRGLAILATNRKSALDRAFLRRLRFLVDFPFPDAESRRRIWQLAFPPQAPVERLEYDALARMEIAGGNIKNIALNAAFLAAAEGAPIGMSHILHATQREYAKIGKSATEAGPARRAGSGEL